MSNRQVASRVWVWFREDGTRWKLAKTDEGFWHCLIGSGGKKLGPWEPGFPPGLEDLPTLFKSL